jgi:hypothetical protein
MKKNLGRFRGFVGVDVSQDRLDVCLLPGGARAGFSRDRRGIARLVAWLASQERLLVVVEATGGLERMLTTALARAAIAVAVVNPRQIRNFAHASGRLAKLVLKSNAIAGRQSRKHSEHARSSYAARSVVCYPDNSVPCFAPATGGAARCLGFWRLGFGWQRARSVRRLDSERNAPQAMSTPGILEHGPEP